MPELATLRADSAALIARSAELCTACRRRIAGSADPDTSLVIETLATSTIVCFDCLVMKTGVLAPKVADLLERLKDIVAMTIRVARCDGCLRVTQTYWVGERRPSGPARTSTAPAPTAAADLAAALWRFLAEHRGEMFCTLCLATALGTSRRVDRVLFGAEGRGARRLHGRCSTCGKDRLLCGLGP